MASVMVLGLKQRARIEFLTAARCLPIELHTRLKAVYYGKTCVDVSTVRQWARRLKELRVHD